MASIALHTTILILIAWLSDSAISGLSDPQDGMRDATAGETGVDAQREISVALVHRISNSQTPADPVDTDASTTPESSGEPSDDTKQSPGGSGTANDTPASPQSNRSMPPGFSPPIDLDGVLSEMMATPEPGANAAMATGAGIGRGGLGDLGTDSGNGLSAKPGDRGLKAAGGGGSAASLFGIAGTGNRIVYVIDRSDSMNGNGGSPLLAAKTELIRSLNALKQSQFFQFVLYDDEPRPYRGAASSGTAVQMIQAELQAIKRAQSYIETVDAFGGTNHVDALRLALRMRPDVIFFLTDGRVPSLSDRELSEIGRIAQSHGTTIHGIEFGTSPTADPTSFIPMLASASGGKYRYFDVTNFSPSGDWNLQPTR